MAELKNVGKTWVRPVLGAVLISGTVVACTTAGGPSAFAGGNGGRRGR
ncbi:MAG: hypothetical protein ACP5OP_03485 [Leptospirillia bacterium]